MGIKRVSIKLPFGIGGVDWEPDKTQRQAAWELYVELVTRVAVERGGDDGILREALASLHAVFDRARRILRKAGPSVGAANDTVGGMAIAMLNRGLRPFTTKWHPLLSAWESGRDKGTGVVEHERAWPEAAKMREELAELQHELTEYSDGLATLAGVSVE